MVARGLFSILVARERPARRTWQAPFALGGDTRLRGVEHDLGRGF